MVGSERRRATCRKLLKLGDEHVRFLMLFFLLYFLIVKSKVWKKLLKFYRAARGRNYIIWPDLFFVNPCWVPVMLTYFLDTNHICNNPSFYLAWRKGCWSVVSLPLWKVEWCIPLTYLQELLLLYDFSRTRDGGLGISSASGLGLWVLCSAQSREPEQTGEFE